MPTGVAFRDGALYVVAIDKLLRYDNAEANLDKMPEPVVVYDDMPPYVAHGWKYLDLRQARARSTCPSARPSTSASRRPASRRSAA